MGVVNNKPQKMATLQKFKLMALHCGAAQSPTRSPRRSPLVQLRPRRSKPTLLMLLTRSSSRSSSRRRDQPELAPSAPPERSLAERHSLKDLFVSSSPPPCFEEKTNKNERNESEESETTRLVVVGGVGPGSPRPGWTGFRYKSLLLRRAWRPVLVAIPE